ncbi:hypothetical protein M514_26566 [Trichuris suis]|uniref:Uncharacterized protein n=1 Tax=Trichuris suis TaxID=68888 RepID=A0A085MVM2_9BILA|nr:hypothetical protein M514_26566 [Trichuris suis]
MEDRNTSTNKDSVRRQTETIVTPNELMKPHLSMEFNTTITSQAAVFASRVGLEVKCFKAIPLIWLKEDCNIYEDHSVAGRREHRDEPMTHNDRD